MTSSGKTVNRKSVAQVMKERWLLSIGHRGARGHGPENTLLSFRKALEIGVPCVELDVYHVDGHLLVFHDDRLERTTNGSGYLLDHSFQYLRSLDAGGGEGIPTLSEVFDTINFRAGINIELKGPNTARPVAGFIAARRRAGWKDHLILISSFNHAELYELHQIDPGIRTGALIAGPPMDGDLSVALPWAYSVHLSLKYVNRRTVDQAHSSGLRVFVFTVNRPRDIRRMRELGVDGVFTDYPERVLVQQEHRDIIGWP